MRHVSFRRRGPEWELPKGAAATKLAGMERQAGGRRESPLGAF
jgi:hypothetical protein